MFSFWAPLVAFILGIQFIFLGIGLDEFPGNCIQSYQSLLGLNWFGIGGACEKNNIIYP